VKIKVDFIPKERMLKGSKHCVFCDEEISYQQFRAQFPHLSETMAGLAWDNPDCEVSCKKCYSSRSRAPYQIIVMILLNLFLLFIFNVFNERGYVFGIHLLDQLVDTLTVINFIIIFTITPFLFVQTLKMKLRLRNAIFSKK